MIQGFQISDSRDQTCPKFCEWITSVTFTSLQIKITRWRCTFKNQTNLFRPKNPARTPSFQRRCERRPPESALLSSQLGSAAFGGCDGAESCVLAGGSPRQGGVLTLMCGTTPCCLRIFVEVGATGGVFAWNKKKYMLNRKKYFAETCKNLQVCTLCISGLVTHLVLQRMTYYVHPVTSYESRTDFHVLVRWSGRRVSWIFDISIDCLLHLSEGKHYIILRAAMHIHSCAFHTFINRKSIVNLWVKGWTESCSLKRLP